MHSKNLDIINVTYPKLSRLKRHENFVMDIKLPTCGLVVTLPPNERCNFVSEFDNCQESHFMLDYMSFFYCWLDSDKNSHFIVGEMVFLCACMVLFVILGSTASNFFCPCLKVISDMMGLSENVAGVTLLAFGRAPSVIAGLKSLGSASRISYTDTMGTAIFVLFVVGGAVIVCQPFHTAPTAFLRDCGFTLFSAVFIHYCFSTDFSVTLIEAISLMSIYVMYIIVVFIDQFLLNRKMRIVMSSGGYMQNVESEHHEIEMQVDIFQQFFYSLNPINVTDWLRASWLFKIIMIVKSPILVALRILIPVVDYELDDCGWSKLLNCVQLWISPSFIIYCIMPSFHIFGVPLYIVCMMVTTPLAIVFFKYTDPSRVPKYHRFLSFLTLSGSMLVIYACATEIMSVLFVLGVTTKRSNSFLGCTLLAWGNSVADLIANLSLARHGNEEMGFGACFGGTLFNILIGIGIDMAYRAATSPGYKTDRFTVGQGSVGETINVFIVIGLLCVVSACALTNFMLRRSIGIFMLFIYVLFFLCCIFIEADLIHPFGSSHRLESMPEAGIVD